MPRPPKPYQPSIPPAQLERWYSPTEVMKVLGIGRTKLQEALARREIAYEKALSPNGTRVRNGAVRISQSAIEQYRQRQFIHVPAL